MIGGNDQDKLCTLIRLRSVDAEIHIAWRCDDFLISLFGVANTEFTKIFKKGYRQFIAIFFIEECGSVDNPGHNTPLFVLHEELEFQFFGVGFLYG